MIAATTRICIKPSSEDHIALYLQVLHECCQI